MPTQQSTPANILELLRAATSERDIGKRIQLLQESQDAILHADTSQDTVLSCLDYFLNLQADPNDALRRFAAYFLERLLFFRPNFALRCTATVAALVKDADGIVQELGVKAACTLHGRALFSLAQEEEGQQFQRSFDSMRQIHDAVKGFLEDGCPKHLSLFQAAIRWAKVLILTQTPSPIMLKIRVPPELRGVASLQDFPERICPFFDFNGMRGQAEELLSFVCRLAEHPPAGTWHCEHMEAILQCLSSVGRQRPASLRPILDVWGRLLRDLCAVEDGRQAKGSLPVVAASAGQVRQTLWGEIQTLLTSSLTVDWHEDLIELLRNDGATGSPEDVVTQAKYSRMCRLLEKQAEERSGEGKAKRARIGQPRRLWTGGAHDLSHEDAFDGDAILSGEIEDTCRRFEDYFGLPSQREPAGHVPGPALLACRIDSDPELGRLALTSLNSLSHKRRLLQDKVHERAVAFSEAPLRTSSEKSMGGSRADKDAPGLALFLAASPSPPGVPEESKGRDPRGPNQRNRDEQRDLSSITVLGADGGQELLAANGIPVQLPRAGPECDSLQLLLFGELLEAHTRMKSSPLSASLSQKQMEVFEHMSRQVALHMAAGTKLTLSSNLQRSMCKCFLLRAFDALKGSPDSKAAVSDPAALGKLVELFYAKFSSDVAKWQERKGESGMLTTALTKTPLRDILEGTPGDKLRGEFTYAELFELFVTEFEKREIPRREMRTFLNEIPVVPLAAFRLLEAQCHHASSRKMALLTVLSLIEGKPSCRWQGLHLLFKLAYCAGEDSSVRFDTIRLIVNKIYTAGPHAPVRWQLPHLNEDEAAPLLRNGSEQGGADGATNGQASDEFIPLRKLRGSCVEELATLMLRSVSPLDAKFAFTVQVQPRLEQLRSEVFQGKVCVPKDRVWLYLALCIKRPILLHQLVETFTKCDPGMKEHLINSIEEAIKHIPASEHELLVLVQKATPETERLVLKVLHILMQTSQGKDGLSQAHGEAVTKLYGSTQNPRLLVPVFDLLDRRHLLDFLPAVLQLEAEQVADAFRQLIRSRSPPLSITELLTELHHMNKANENIVPLKYSMQALNIIFSMKDQFDPKVYGIVIQSLVEEQGPLPTLFMRTVIQVVKELPRLSDFVVMEILPRLVRQEVWGNENMWRGFMIVLQHTFASQPGGAARVLAMLPTSQLEDVLVQHPDWKAQLREFVARQPPGLALAHVRQLLQ